MVYAREPDPVHAAELGNDALAVGHRTGSARIRHELDELDKQLRSRWPELPLTRRLHAALADVEVA